MPELQTECFIATLFTAITRTGVLFMWPVRVPAADGRTNDWHVVRGNGGPARDDAVGPHQGEHELAGL